jgi:para-nitrobenzyl esterase
MFDGSTLARRGKAVVVTFNYRLGPFGFLYLEGLSGTGLGSAPNVGILDQIAALEWVRDNIGAFGGDPGNVTVFGESGGGLSVAVLLAMPRARGLFHHAICQSAAADSVFTAEEGSHVAELFLAELDVRPEDAGSLAELPTEALLSAAQSVFAKVFGAVGLPPFRPVVDGQVLPRLPLEAIRAGQAADVPLMAGTTLDETKLAGASIPHLLSLDHSALKKELKSRFARSDLAAEPVIDAYTRIRAARGQDTNPTDLFHAIETDRMLRVPTTQLLEAHAPHQPRTYSYLFTWTSPNPKLGSCHTLELPFIFGTHRLPAMDEFAGTGPDAEALANRMQDAWIAFSRSGDPNNTGLPDWPAYNSEDRTTMLLGKTCRAQNDPFGPERLYWQEALERSGV